MARGWNVPDNAQVFNGYFGSEKNPECYQTFRVFRVSQRKPYRLLYSLVEYGRIKNITIFAIRKRLEKSRTL